MGGYYSINNAQIPEWPKGVVCKTIDSLVRTQLCAQNIHCNLAQWQSIPFIWEWSMVRIHQLQQSYDTIPIIASLTQLVQSVTLTRWKSLVRTQQGAQIK